LESFFPIIGEAILQLPESAISLRDLQRQLRQNFGLDIPRNTIQTLLLRLRAKGYVVQKDGAVYKNKEVLTKLNFKSMKESVLESHRIFIEGLREHAQRAFAKDWDTTKAQNVILTYLKQHQLLVVASSVHGTVIPTIPAAQQSDLYVIADFVQACQKENPAYLTYLDTLAKGNMLANALYLTDIGSPDIKFRETTLYFDTSFLIFALGYAGEEREQPCRELLELCYAQNASLACFSHTYDEVYGVLDACAHRIRSGQLRDAYGPTIEYFLERRLSDSDIQLIMARLETDLKALRIEVLEKPEYFHALVIDEAALESEIRKRIEYKTDQAARRDVDSISAIYRLRGERTSDKVERCRALFVTTNHDLVNATRKFFIASEGRPVIPLCLTDYDVTNLVWLKNPSLAPNLPFHQLIANAYAALQPSEVLWKKYLEEVTQLEKQGKFTAQDVHLLRYSMDAKHILMDKTLGDEGAFTAGTPAEILEIVQNNIRQVVVSERDEERKHRESAEKALFDTRTAELARKQRIKNLSSLWGRRSAKLCQTIFLCFLVGGAAASLPWSFPDFMSSSIRYSLSGLWTILMGLSLADLWKGQTLRGIVRRIEIRISHFIESTLNSLID